MRAFKKLFRFVFTLAILAAPFIVWWQWQAIYDWYRLRNYSPPVAISALAAQDTMTAHAEHLFYINHPQLVDDVTTFHSDCPSSEQTIVLGCYQDHENGIYIYNVQDAQLDGVQQVTAAHEMLHAAYGRLSAKERNYVDGLLTDYYQNDLHDQRLIDTINDYKKTEPNDVVNEMHSIFGTEVAKLPQPLEDYYQQYFSNRAAVTTFAAGYESQFTDRLNQIKADDAKLATMKAQINSEEQSLKQQYNQIQADRNRSAVSNSAFKREVNAYNQGVNQLKADISAFNELVKIRNALAVELRGLDSAIDTRLTTQAAQ